MSPKGHQGGNSKKGKDEMTFDEGTDPVTKYVTLFLESIEDGSPAPDVEGLTPSERVEAEGLLSRLDLDSEIDIQIPPIDESALAIARGIVRRPPAVSVCGDALQRARSAASLSASEVADQLTALGVTSDNSRVEELEDAESTLMSPSDARRLAAVVGVALEEIEASGEPWPASERDALGDIGNREAPLEMGKHLVLVLGDAFYGGVVRCRGRARDLDSLTFRRVAGGLLHGTWNQLQAAILVTENAPRKVLVLDAFDCTPHVGAPSGEYGYGSLPPADDLDSAIGDYDARFGIEWTDPSEFSLSDSPRAWKGLIDMRHLQTAVDSIASSLGRYAELKRDGCKGALERFAETSLEDSERLTNAIGNASDDEEAERLLGQVVSK